MCWPFKFETYQDVKSNLALATLVILYLACMLTYLYILPEQHARVLKNLRWAAWLQQVGLVTVLTVISGFLIYGIQVHDQVYDRYIVRWRDRYTREVILPRLCKPFQSRLDPRFYEVANASRENRRDFMEKLFYEYVHDREPRIRQNTLVRFYERITNYWATQIIELVVYCMLIVTIVYVPVYRRFNEPIRNLIVVLVVLSGSLALTSYLGIATRNSAQELTEEEIDEIHTNFLPDLESRVRGISARYSLKYE